MTNSPDVSLADAVVQARRLFKQGRKAEAAEIYRGMPKVYGSTRKVVAEAADGLLKCGFWSEAVELYNVGLAKNPISPSYLGGLAEAFAEKKDYARAVTYLERNVDFDPLPTNLIGLGVMQSMAEDWKGAEASFTRALAAEPLSENAALGRGEALRRLGRTEESINAYRRVISVNPSNAHALMQLGIMLVHPSTAAEAESLLQRSIEIEPRNTPAYVNLATACFLQNKVAEAVTWGRKAVETNPDTDGAQYILGVMSLEAGDAAGALPALRRATQLAPKHPGAMAAVAMAETALGNVSAAELAWQIVLTFDSKNVAARHMLSALQGAGVSRLPADYVERHFDEDAKQYDHLRSFSYRGPQDIADLLAAQSRQFRRWLDVGCGTGLLAEALRGSAKFDVSIGIDASSKMLDQAREKKVYGDLLHGDALAIMSAMSEPFDLITAVDVFPYVGDLTSFLPVLAQCLAPKGVFAYSAEHRAEGTYKLEPRGRFSHSAAYIEKLGRAAGLTPVAQREVTLRIERGRPVTGVIGLFEKSA